MYEVYEKVKEENKRKHKYSNINLWLIPEVANNIKEIPYQFIREYIRELINNRPLLLSVPLETADEFFNNHGHILKRLHSKMDLHDKWIALSFASKKRLYYLVNQKLLEVLNDELRINATRPPS